MNKQQLIDHLELEPHVEGGYFKRSFESTLSTTLASDESRLLMTSIYYLLTNDSPIGYFHRNRSTIVHYWQGGSALRYWLINPEGQLNKKVLGPNLLAGEQLQLTVPGNYWKATELISDDYGLLSEAVCPGFDFADMTLASANDMKKQYPQHWPEISRFCKP